LEVRVLSWAQIRHKIRTAADFVLFVSRNHKFSAENLVRQGRAAKFVTTNFERLTKSSKRKTALSESGFSFV
jgi:hypothetical protein